MDKEVLDHYLKAGEIWSSARQVALETAKPGVKLLELADTIEKHILEKGGKHAFPVNLSLNEEAAHATPAHKDETVLGKDVIKIDMGVIVEGYICDAAFSLDFSGKHQKQIEANQRALAQAIAAATNGADVGEVGKVVETTLKNAGFSPVQNLTGHGLDRFEQHASPSIPNLETRGTGNFENDRAYAIEPFASTGKGLVHEGAKTEIYRFEEPRPIRNPVARQIMEIAAKEFGTMPFADRWLIPHVSATDFARKMAMKELLKSRVLASYPVLRETGGVIVTQAENTIILHEEKTIPLVKNWPPEQ